MAEHFFAYLARQKYINRWSLMKNTREENLIEHSYMVSVIAHALVSIRRDVFGKTDVDAEKAACAALFHDAAEIFTGDLPTPIKYYNSAIHDAYKCIEDSSRERLVKMLPQELEKTYTELFDYENDEPLRRIVKAADKLSAYLKCIEELNSSNAEFSSAKRGIEEDLKRYGMPEVDYFIEHFVPGFSMTIDEQEKERSQRE